MMDRQNPWKYVKVNPKDIENNPYLNPAKQDPEQPTPPLQGNERVLLSGSYSVIQENTFGLALDSLRKAIAKKNIPIFHQYITDKATTLVRPLTFRETLEARLNDYETLKNPDDTVRTDDERKALLVNWLDSCTGIAYKAGTTKFKILPLSEDLIMLPKGFNETFKEVDYNSLKGIELDGSNGTYNGLLTKAEILSHPAWRAAVEDDTLLLVKYTDLIFKLLPKQNKVMGFYVRSNTAKDELRALAVGDLGGSSLADGNGGLDGRARFVRVNPSSKAP